MKFKIISIFLSVGILFTMPVEAKQKSKSSQKSSYSCSKKTCKQMRSCEEAYYKLEVCGHKARDRDRDGVPCESICPGG